MLSDHERETLHEIQRRLLVEDPDFAQTFDVDAQHLNPDSPGLDRRVYTILLVLSSTLGVILLVAGLPIGALALAAVAALVWELRRRRDDVGHEQP